ncbi:MAG TPA: hypothetical protein VJJ78_02755 [Candidatus Saccharimonadales bacterium]|nr:hypothetical protein [Candidatus Saccharimonadales bacterium]
MAEQSGDKPSIPLTDIIAWHAEQVKELGKMKAKYEATRNLAGHHLSDDHPSVGFSLGEIHGREEVLNGLSAFVMTHSADLAGKLDPNQAITPGQNS